MTENHIDLTITQAQVDALLVGLKAIDEILPGLIELTPEKRKSMDESRQCLYWCWRNKKGCPRL